MAPELPPRLVTVDLRFEREELEAAVEYIEIAGAGRLRVRWDTKTQPPGFFPVCGGVAYVEQTEHVTVGIPDKDVQPSSLGHSRYRWIQGLLPKDRWMMLILVLPEGQTIVNPNPLPADAKSFDGRLAVYWRLKADEIGSTEAEWTLKRLQGRVQSEAERLNATFAKSKLSPPNADADGDVYVEDVLGRKRGQRSSNKEENGSHSNAMKLLLTLIPVVAGLILGYWQLNKPGHVEPADTVRYSGRVIDANTQQVIQGAQVSVDTKGPPEIYYTDNVGVFDLNVQRSVDAIHIRVDAKGYEIFDRRVSLSRTGLEEVRLVPKAIPTPAPTVTPRPTRTSAKNDNTYKILTGQKKGPE